jgi:PKHD-type hydroxylase
MFINNHFYQFDSYFSKKFCNEVIEYIDKTKLNKGTVGNNNLNIKNRDSDIVFIDENWINKEIYFLIKEANKQTWNFEVDSYEPVQFTKYGLNQHYDWHMDSYPIKNLTEKIRKLSIIIALNDSKEYIGGDVLIQNMDIYNDYKIFNCDVLKKIGSVVVFPSFIFHKVMPITSGIRYSLVNWIRGDNFK